jgi:hypothetical protein
MAVIPTGRSSHGTLVAVLTVLVALNWFQWRYWSRERIIWRAAALVPINGPAPPIELPTPVSGQRESLDLSEPGSRALVILLTQFCGFCSANVTKWSSLAALAAKNGVPVYVVNVGAREGPRKLFDIDRIGGTVVDEVTQSFKWRWRANLVPQTVFVDDRTVRFASIGELTRAEVQALEAQMLRGRSKQPDKEH